MKRTASELIRNLEQRVARLEQTKTAGGLPLELYFYEGKVGVAVDSGSHASTKLKDLYHSDVKEQSLGYEIVYFKEPRLTEQGIDALRIWGGGKATGRGKLTSKNSSVDQRVLVLSRYLNPVLYTYLKELFDLTTTEITIY
jgi:hypothetical protein